MKKFKLYIASGFNRKVTYSHIEWLNPIHNTDLNDFVYSGFYQSSGTTNQSYTKY